MKRTFGSFAAIAGLAVMLSATAGGQQKSSTRKAGEATEDAGATAGKAGDKGLDAAGKGVGAAVEHTGRSLAKVGKVLAGKDTKKSGPDSFDKAGNATEGAFDKAGDGLSTGIKATGKGVGAAVTHGGGSAVKGGKATGKAMAKTGEAVGDAFTDDNDSSKHQPNKDQRRDAQRALEAKGYYRGPIDGIIGPKTRSGLREYQGDNGLEVTGKLDAKTAQSLGVN